MADRNSMPRDPVLMELIPLEQENCHAALLTLNNPASLNPVDQPTFLRLEERFQECEEDSSVRAILITGAGDAFSAGGDLKKYIDMRKDPAAWQQFLEDGRRVFRKARLNSKPVVSLVNGTAVAGGLELIVASDFAYASETARIGDAHVRFGQMGGGGALTLVHRAIGAPKARELIFSGRLLPAEEAREWGIVNKVVPPDQLIAAGVEFANTVAQWSPLAIAHIKQVMNESIEQGLGVESQWRFEQERAAVFTLTSEDSAEGLIAFSEKRTPRFTGR